MQLARRDVLVLLDQIGQAELYLREDPAVADDALQAALTKLRGMMEDADGAETNGKALIDSVYQVINGTFPRSRLTQKDVLLLRQALLTQNEVDRLAYTSSRNGAACSGCGKTFSEEEMLTYLPGRDPEGAADHDLFCGVCATPYVISLQDGSTAGFVDSFFEAIAETRKKGAKVTPEAVLRPLEEDLPRPTRLPPLQYIPTRRGQPARPAFVDGGGPGQGDVEAATPWEEAIDDQGG